MESEAAKNPDLVFGLYTDNPYMLQEPIVRDRVFTAIVPKRNFKPEDQQGQTPEEIFEERYFILNKENFYEMNGDNKGMFYIRKLEKKEEPAPVPGS